MSLNYKQIINNLSKNIYTDINISNIFSYENVSNHLEETLEFINTIESISISNRTKPHLEKEFYQSIFYYQYENGDTLLKNFFNMSINLNHLTKKEFIIYSDIYSIFSKVLLSESLDYINLIYQNNIDSSIKKSLIYFDYIANYFQDLKFGSKNDFYNTCQEISQKMFIYNENPSEENKEKLIEKYTSYYNLVSKTYTIRSNLCLYAPILNYHIESENKINDKINLLNNQNSHFNNNLKFKLKIEQKIDSHCILYEANILSDKLMLISSSEGLNFENLTKTTLDDNSISYPFFIRSSSVLLQSELLHNIYQYSKSKILFDTLNKNILNKEITIKKNKI